MFLKTFRPAPKSPSLIKDVHESHTPSLWSGALTGNRWRHRSMGKTLEHITDEQKHEELQKQAQKNLALWSKKLYLPPKVVEVVHKDWGLATLEATRKHGVAYSVLNMANPIFPGGAALEGGSAQEENMWHRSTCSKSLLDKSIYLDEESRTFRYNETARKLLEGKLTMTDEERAALRKRRGEVDSIVYKILYNREPNVCFRGPEETLITSGFDDFTPSRRIPDSARSYNFLPHTDIFPFYEFRSAAPDLSSEPIDPNPKILKQYIADLRQRIAAQLDTLILEGKSNIILGAWGCGEFKNDPHVVAEVYREEIEKRAQHFDHIVFPIINTNAHNNHAIFEKHLNGMKLGITNVLDTTPGFQL